MNNNSINNNLNINNNTNTNTNNNNNNNTNQYNNFRPAALNRIRNKTMYNSYYEQKMYNSSIIDHNTKNKK